MRARSCCSPRGVAAAFTFVRLRASTDTDRRVERGGSRVRPSAGRLVAASRTWRSCRPGVHDGQRHGVPRGGARSDAERRGNFWIDRTEVTNAQFAEFVAATGYVTLAERGVRTAMALDAPVVAGSAVFRAADADKRRGSPRNAETGGRSCPERAGASPRVRVRRSRGATTSRRAHRVRGCGRVCRSGGAQPTDRGAVRVRGADELAARCGGRARSEHVAGLFPTLSDPVDGYAGHRARCVLRAKRARALRPGR